MSNEKFNPKDHGIEKFGTITMSEDGNIELKDFELIGPSDKHPEIVCATVLSDFFQAFAEHVRNNHREEL